jgi:hypothetical protein
LEVASMPEGERVVVNGALELCFEVLSSECILNPPESQNEPLYPKP